MNGLRRWCVRVAIVTALPLLAACSGGGGTGDAPQDVPADALASATEGAAAMGQFDFAAAERAFEAAREKAPQWRTAQLDVAISILNQSVPGAQERALALLQPLAGDPDLGVRAAYCMGLAYLFLGDPAAALPQFRRAAEAFPEDPHAAYYTGQSLELTGEWKAALPWYRRALELDPYLRSAALGVQRVLAREGDAAGAEEALKLFDMLAQNPRSTLAEFKYSRMGRLGEIVLPEDAVVVPPRAGALFGPFVPLKVNNWPATHSPSAFLAAVDIDSDGWTDLLWVATIAQPAGNPARKQTLQIVVLRNVGGAEGADTSYDARVATDLDPLLGSTGAWMTSQWGDLNNDGKIDVVCKSSSSGGVVLLVQDAAGVFAESKMDLGSVTISLLNGLADLDHDGDLDIMANESFAPPPGQSGGRQHRPAILYNRLDAGWEVVPLPVQPLDRWWTLRAADVDADGDSDIIASSAWFSQGSVRVLINDRLWKWTDGSSRFAPLTTTPLSRCVAFERADDGVLLLAGLKHRGGTTRPDCDLQVWAFERSGVRLVRSTHYGIAVGIMVADFAGSGQPMIGVMGTYEGGPLGRLVPLEDSMMLADSAGSWVGDVSLESKKRYQPPDIAIIPVHGVVMFDQESLSIRGGGPGRMPLATLSFRGRIDPAQQMRSNASGVGTRAVARVGGGWVASGPQQWNSGDGFSPTPAIIGLGSSPYADFVRIDWSDGVLQTEPKIAAGTHTIVETQRQISSCPVIFAWDGSRMRFVTDCLGVGGLGYLASVQRAANGALNPVYAPPRPQERVALPADALVERGGRFLLSLAEPMEEMTALDAAALHFVDLPAGWRMALDERMGISDPQPTGRVLAYRRSAKPIRCEARYGASADAAMRADQTAQTAQVDGVAADPGVIDPRFIGRTREPFALQFDFGCELAGGADGADGAQPVLLLDGWVEYPYCQTNFAMWQANAPLDAPTFEALDPASGSWVTLVAHYGYPAGMPRQAAFPLPLEQLPRGARSLRIVTNHELYVDAVELAWVEPCPQMRESTAPLMAAAVRDSGFAQRLPTEQRRPEYDWQRRVPLWDCRKQLGWYTAVGVDCAPLVSEVDDAVAIFGAGEEVELAFQAALPRLESGFSRFAFLEVHGWCKDMDFLTGDGQTIEPLPRRGVADAGASPNAAAAETAAADAKRESLHRQFNTRYEGGR